MRHDDADSDVQEVEAKAHHYVFSLYEGTGKDGYQIYKNGDKFAFFNLEEGRRLVDMRVHRNDCYVLVSEHITDSTSCPAEIYKNGHPAMRFDDGFRVTDFDLDNGHFLVLGHFGDTLTVVYKDGVKVLQCPYSREWKPVGVSAWGQDLYIALQGENSIKVYKEDKFLRSYPGVKVDFRVSMMGVYMLTETTLYRDAENIMGHEYYRYADKEMFADPKYLSISNDNSYVGAQSTIDGSKNYACVFRNREGFLTVKPDDKPIGKSEMQTYCTGVAVSNENVYSAVIKLTEAGDTLMPLSFIYYYNHDEAFHIDFPMAGANLLFMESTAK